MPTNLLIGLVCEVANDLIVCQATFARSLHHEQAIARLIHREAAHVVHRTLRVRTVLVDTEVL